MLGLPTIAVIGRPNVGKSTLVNRMIGRREAIVEDTPGVTRDRVKYEAEWNGRRFFLIDTGGWEVKPEGISEKITAGSEAAIAEADLVMFVVDAQVGALDEDQSLVDLLRKSGKMTDMLGNELTYNNKNVCHENGILVSNGLIHKKILEEFLKICGLVLVYCF